MSSSLQEKLSRYSLLEALENRRSRRFGLGMEMKTGPLAFSSLHAPVALSEEEEALLVFAACGITGHALLDLTFGPGLGGTIVARSVGRTVASGDAIQAVAMVLTNDEATYLIKRPQDLRPAEIPELIELAHKKNFVEVYQRVRTKISERRTSPPLTPLFNINVNQWSMYRPGTSYFLPINELTFMYINGLLEIFNEDTGAFVVGERASFRPAGLDKFARSRGGHLNDNSKDGRVLTVQRLELMVSEFVTVEQGMMLQNMALMAQAIGLGGFPNFAEHEYSWFQALGFRMGQMPAGKYLGANYILKGLMAASGRNKPVPYALGLEHKGTVLMGAYCPPYYPEMGAAVRAVIDCKYGAQGTFRGGIEQSAWLDPKLVSHAIPDLSDRAVAATMAYCEYIHHRYGRFPAYMPPFRTVLGFQACHLETEFYRHYYRPDALSETQREHMKNWHDGDSC